ncbi:LysR family transcriptional regulator [Defluviimonas sp. WL0002]|uniref:LysR family transcriptional regulator n=1 Tax=Albidovulum marisflavi TaxID=2984159 RepID=A0ABT2ZEK2_9RHOB|nr:LysR family transcriptional regulator [Defluviimonas sp. WL0002]MCV2869563.1 LysR family transcriptional regulator [Defluviimonas sp. WL0002]
MRTFLRVLDLGSFTAASLDAGLAPGAASQIVKELEAHLGVSLLVRTTRSLRPTEEGTRYAARARLILADVAELEDEVGGAERQVRGQLRVQIPSGLSRMLAGPALVAFTQRYPALSVEVVSDSGLPDFQTRRLDAAIFIGELPERDVLRRSLGRVPLMVTAAPGYLDRRGRPATPGDLSAHDCIGILSGQSGQRLDWRFRRGGEDIHVPVPSALAFDSSEAAVAAAVAGGGLLQMITYLLAEEMRRGALVQVLDDWLYPGPEISLVTPRLARKPRKLRVFEAFLTETVRRYGRRWRIGTEPGITPSEEPAA